jgi:hypothetical protein
MNVITSLLGLVIVSHLDPKGSGRFRYLCCVTMRVLLKLLIILYNTLAPSTLISIITSLEIMLLKETLF